MDQQVYHQIIQQIHHSPYSNHPTASPAMQMDYQRKYLFIFYRFIYFLFSLKFTIAYSSHIPTPGAINNNYSSSSSNNQIQSINHPAGNYVYSPSMNINTSYTEVHNLPLCHLHWVCLFVF